MAKAALSIVSKLDIEHICDMVRNGESLTAIAKSVGLSQGNLTDWIGRDQVRSARVREARSTTGAIWDQKAEDVLNDPNIEFQRARELASHYRWRASKIAPRDYGDKQTIEHTGDITLMNDEQRRARLAELQAKVQIVAPHKESK